MFEPLKTLVIDRSIPEDSLVRAFERVSRGIGWFAIALPLGCVLAAWSGIAPPIILRDSISHFYYVPIMGDYFVGCLFFIGILLLFFFHTKGNEVPGWGNLYWIEVILIRIAGIAALMIAVFPTLGAGGAFADDEFHRVFLTAGGEPNFGALPGFAIDLGLKQPIPLHAIGALVMFSILTYFTLVIFTRTQRPNSEMMLAGKAKQKPRKRKRNMVYIVLGFVIGGSTAAIVVHFINIKPCDGPCPESLWQARNATFWFECAALLSFGLAWLIKGGAIAWLNDDP